MFIKKCLKRQLEARNFVFAETNEGFGVLLLTNANESEFGLLVGKINKTLMPKGQLIGYTLKDDFAIVKFYKKA